MVDLVVYLIDDLGFCFGWMSERPLFPVVPSLLCFCTCLLAMVVAIYGDLVSEHGDIA